MPVDESGHRPETAKTCPKRPETQERETLSNIRGFGGRVRLLAFLAMAGIGLAAGCASEQNPNKPGTQEVQTQAPLQIDRMNTLHNADYTQYTGLEIEYTLPYSIQNAQITVTDMNDQPLHEETVDLDEGNQLLQVEFPQAGEARTITIEGLDKDNNPFTVSESFPEIMFE
ncbi:hypothetical protein ACFLZH_05390 [Patescibacteria group bacterium]